MENRRTQNWRDHEQINQLLCSPIYAVDIAGTLHTPPYKDKAVIREKYEAEGLSIAQISSQILCSKDAVRRALRSEGVVIREPGQHHGRPSQPQYGDHYRNGKLIRHLGETRVKRTVLEMREAGLSLRQIAKFLDQIGVPTKCRGRKWHPEMVKRILFSLPNAGGSTAETLSNNLEEDTKWTKQK